MKKLFIAATAAAAAVWTAGTAFAAGWQSGKEPGKVLTYYELEDGTRASGGWFWLDDDGDGVSECYYFLENGEYAKDDTRKMLRN